MACQHLQERKIITSKQLEGTHTNCSLNILDQPVASVHRTPAEYADPVYPSVMFLRENTGGYTGFLPLWLLGLLVLMLHCSIADFRLKRVIVSFCRLSMLTCTEPFHTCRTMHMRVQPGYALKSSVPPLAVLDRLAPDVPHDPGALRHESERLVY